MNTPAPLDFLARAERGVLRVVETLLVVGLLAILSWVFVLVVLRYGFSSSIIGGIEVLRILFVYSTALGAAVAIAYREHIAVSVLTERLSRPFQSAADIFSFLLVAAFNGMAIWYSVPWIGKTGYLLLPATEMPQYVAQACIPIGCGLAILFCLIRAFRTLTGTEKPRWVRE